MADAGMHRTIPALPVREVAAAVGFYRERFGFEVPTRCTGVPDDVLWPRNMWKDQAAYDAAAKRLAGLFQKNFHQFEAGCSPAVAKAGPRS